MELEVGIARDHVLCLSDYEAVSTAEDAHAPPHPHAVRRSTKCWFRSHEEHMAVRS